MEILYSFKSTETENVTYLFEIKFLNMPLDAPKSDKYKWFIFSEGQLKTLEFKSLNGKTRNFQCGLFLDIENLKFTHNELTKDLIKCSEQDNEFIRNLLHV